MKNQLNQRTISYLYDTNNQTIIKEILEDYLLKYNITFDNSIFENYIKNLFNDFDFKILKIDGVEITSILKISTGEIFNKGDIFYSIMYKEIVYSKMYFDSFLTGETLLGTFYKGYIRSGISAYGNIYHINDISTVETYEKSKEIIILNLKKDEWVYNKHFGTCYKIKNIDRINNKVYIHNNERTHMLDVWENRQTRYTNYVRYATQEEIINELEKQLKNESKIQKDKEYPILNLKEGDWIFNDNDAFKGCFKIKNINRQHDSIEFYNYNMNGYNTLVYWENRMYGVNKVRYATQEEIINELEKQLKNESKIQKEKEYPELILKEGDWIYQIKRNECDRVNTVDRELNKIWFCYSIKSNDLKKFENKCYYEGKRVANIRYATQEEIINELEKQLKQKTC